MGISKIKITLLSLALLSLISYGTYWQISYYKLEKQFIATTNSLNESIKANRTLENINKENIKLSTTTINSYKYQLDELHKYYRGQLDNVFSICQDYESSKLVPIDKVEVIDEDTSKNRIIDRNARVEYYNSRMRDKTETDRNSSSD